MACLERKRIAQRAGIAALLMVALACGDEEKKSSNDDDDDTQEEGEPGGKLGDASVEFDGFVPPPPPEPVTDGQVKLPPPVQGNQDAGSDVPPPPPPPPPGTVDPLTTPLQHDGQLQSVCYEDADCTGDNLGCWLPFAAQGPGICVARCTSDMECAPLDGVPGICDTSALVGGTCEYECGGPENDGKGPCPKNMECRNFLAPLPTWQCAYPIGGGKKTEPLYGKCNPAHGAGDCQGDNVCAHPAASIESLEYPNGYCSPKCTKHEECVTPGGATAVGECFMTVGQCRFDCADDKTCPTGMVCATIGPFGFPVKRCTYED